MKKSLLAVVMVMAAVMGLVALSGGEAQAAWVTCTITQVGATGTNYWVTASDSSPAQLFNNVTFVIDETNGRGKEMYLSALTAFANSTYLWLWVDAPYGNYGTAWGAIAAKYPYVQ